MTTTHREYMAKLDKLSDAAGYINRYMSIAEAEDILDFTLGTYGAKRTMRDCDIELAKFTLNIR